MNFRFSRSEFGGAMRAKLSSMSQWSGLPVNGRAAAVAGAINEVKGDVVLDLHDALQLADAGLGGRASMKDRRAVVELLFPGMLSGSGGTRTLAAAAMPLAAAAARVRGGGAGSGGVRPVAPPVSAKPSTLPVVLGEIDAVPGPDDGEVVHRAYAKREWGMDRCGCRSKFPSESAFLSVRIRELRDLPGLDSGLPLYEPKAAPVVSAAPTPPPVAPVAPVAVVAVVPVCGPVPSPHAALSVHAEYAEKEWANNVADVHVAFARFGKASFMAIRTRELRGVPGCRSGCPTWTPPPSAVVPTKEAAEAQARSEWAADTGGCRGRYILSGESGYVRMRSMELRGESSSNGRGGWSMTPSRREGGR